MSVEGTMNNMRLCDLSLAMDQILLVDSFHVQLLQLPSVSSTVLYIAIIIVVIIITSDQLKVANKSSK